MKTLSINPPNYRSSAADVLVNPLTASFSFMTGLYIFSVKLLYIIILCLVTLLLPGSRRSVKSQVCQE